MNDTYKAKSMGTKLGRGKGAYGSKKNSMVPYKEGAWWYIDVEQTGTDKGKITKKKFSSEEEAKAWLKSEGK